MATALGATPGGSVVVETSEAVTIGATAVRLLFANKKRTAWRVRSDRSNNLYILLGKSSRVSYTAGYFEWVPPGFIIIDDGDQKTIYRGEVWMIAEGAGQTVLVEETIQR